MEVYIVTLLLIFIFGFLDLRLKLNDSQRNWLVFFLYFIIVIQIGLRWETGSDWLPYLENFQNTDEYSTVLINALIGYEIGYGTFAFFIKKLFDSYSVFLFIHALIFYWGIFRMAQKYSPYFFISILFFYATNLGMVGSNRQLLAIIICLYSLVYVFERKPFKFLVVIGVACLFHTTAFLFGIYYFLNRNFKTITVVLVLIISFVIGKTGLPFLMFSKLGGLFGELAASKIIAYSEGAKDVLAESSLSVFGLIKRLLFIAIFTYYYSFLSKKLSYYKVLYNGYVFGMVIYFLFASSLLILVNRGSLYFNIMESLLISCQFLVFSKRSDKAYVFFVLLLLSIVILFQSIAAYPELFDPYKGLFYNVNFKREMF
ncbi:EpsG family protein [Flavobacterium sp. LS1P28]|uniref:EpsG family protein n=1 Tax=Flavobacterium sp. LS1P28 TaxID=2497752 RepID=UPI000F841CEC|nr:EpsG family protein [Flavobacterium sp. LS1P28]RTY83463.1 EpsG family protein [Flavobacterium sp. LS1P28]